MPWRRFLQIVSESLRQQHSCTLVVAVEATYVIRFTAVLAVTLCCTHRDDLLPCFWQKLVSWSELRKEQLCWTDTYRYHISRLLVWIPVLNSSQIHWLLWEINCAGKWIKSTGPSRNAFMRFAQKPLKVVIQRTFKARNLKRKGKREAPFSSVTCWGTYTNLSHGFTKIGSLSSAEMLNALRWSTLISDMFWSVWWSLRWMILWCYLRFVLRFVFDPQSMSMWVKCFAWFMFIK